MIGEKTGKCIGYGVLSKFCYRCSIGQDPSTHDCPKNFEGSSKAMESALAVKMLKALKEEGYTVKTLIMDDDTTTISRVRKEVDSYIEKKSDRNHVRKNISNELYKGGVSYAPTHQFCSCFAW